METQIKETGFKLTDSYKHDQYHTNRYKQGCLEVEFTYENKKGFWISTKPLVVRSAAKKCWSCKHRSSAFKVGKLTHYHCVSPSYIRQHEAGVAISPWETLRVFSDSCEEHEFR